MKFRVVGAHSIKIALPTDPSQIKQTLKLGPPDGDPQCLLDRLFLGFFAGGFHGRFHQFIVDVDVGAHDALLCVWIANIIHIDDRIVDDMLEHCPAQLLEERPINGPPPGYPAQRPAQKR